MPLSDTTGRGIRTPTAVHQPKGHNVALHTSALELSRSIMWFTLTFRGADSWRGLLMQSSGIAKLDFRLRSRKVRVNRDCNTQQCGIAREPPAKFRIRACGAQTHSSPSAVQPETFL
jgi:hypothetical protein